jgi:NAD(P)-dependent dehydrogenase (short-subunit alcohol dehydrogenase family)
MARQPQCLKPPLVIKRMDKHSQRVAIITGAVGNLGFATARVFQTAGYRMVLVDRSQERLLQTYADLVGSDQHLLVGGVDLGTDVSVHELIGTTLNHFGRIDVLVNTVGAWRGGQPAHESDLADWDFLFHANLRTALLACRGVVPTMLKQRSGRIINVASRDALVGTAGYGAYSASKTAVLRLTESLADELKQYEINVNCILPGTIDTPQNRAALPKADFSKWVEPSALADVIQFLASDAARAITGAAIPVFGRS